MYHFVTALVGQLGLVWAKGVLGVPHVGALAGWLELVGHGPGVSQGFPHWGCPVGLVGPRVIWARAAPVGWLQLGWVQARVALVGWLELEWV